jgi:hypothetical protein
MRADQKAWIEARWRSSDDGEDAPCRVHVEKASLKETAETAHARKNRKMTVEKFLRKLQKKRTST